MTVINPFDFFIEEHAEEYPFEYSEELKQDLKPYLAIKESGPRLTEYLKGFDKSPRRTITFLIEANQKVQSDIGYSIRMEPGVQTCEESLERKSRSCRDTAWLLMQVLRHFGFATRFVSGYLIQLKPDQLSLDGPSGATEDFTDLHAWTEVYIPGAGWIGLDATSGLLASEGHIPLACTPLPSSAAPIDGTSSHPTASFEHTMKITRVHEDPRVTKPYTDKTWDRILKLGDQVEEDLIKNDVRLTMGGEPTFVSIDDQEGDEWNTAAVGPVKKRLSEELLGRLEQRFSNGALLHFGQGKWYPGEPLPRWAMTCLWRKDGEPIWKNEELIGSEEQEKQVSIDDAAQFAETLCDHLSVEPKWVNPAYEDVWNVINEEQKLPVNVDPKEFDLDKAEERAKLARSLERGVTEPTGFVLPLKRAWWQAEAKWASGPWPFRSPKLFLIPGDSPIGLRLPLDSLPNKHNPDDPRPDIYEVDPFEPRSSLPRYVELRNAVQQAALEMKSTKTEFQKAGDKTEGEGTEREPLTTSSGGPKDIVRTAMCIEPRDGQLFVFMPPTESLEDYLDLTTAIEETAEQLQTPVVLEGYLPPHDDRIELIKVTPDPGVIEVNVHPAKNWRDLVDITTSIYEEAHQCRLGTEKFQLDGRHAGTGGGNHIVMGGQTVADSPFLRRPDLLGSLLAYWNNHPSLSYLFSGLFVGPTCQAPRIDEGRRDAVYELQIALNLLKDIQNPQPWLVDRLFRHLAVDLTGNTHRAEFCIDKLYSPDSSTGRLGLVEFRAFEMPPHARMSLTQQLLLRALVARFWETPYDGQVIDWDTQLHDRFMLPHFLMTDFQDVIDDLKKSGYDFNYEWFLPHIDFRCQQIGTVEYDGLKLEIRQAIEPWYVLGEEAAGGGMTRFVDSSTERLEVKLTGGIPDRYIVTCNQRAVPLSPAGVVGESVGGVRFRAWKPPSCLHPTIPVHVPLVFDVVDT
ncbi:MAG: transglutaminase family protein [Planctomycetaceae bacterium]|nr:transglutaminase family protein [Planctomycetaceae bacterium]